MKLTTWAIVLLCFTALEIYAQAQVSLRPTEILALTQPGGPDRIRLTNTASRTVVAFSIRHAEDRGFQTTEFYPPAVFGIAPGATFETTMPGPVRANGKATLEDYTPSAVLFADGSAEGDADELTAMDQRRTGEADELDRLMPLLNTIRTSADDKTEGAIQACVASTADRLVELYKPVESNPGYASGMASAANSVKRPCDEALSLARDRSPSAARDRISRIAAKKMGTVAAVRASRLKMTGK